MLTFSDNLVRRNTLACGPILFAWALYQHGKRWLARRRGDG